MKGNVSLQPLNQHLEAEVSVEEDTPPDGAQVHLGGFYEETMCICVCRKTTGQRHKSLSIGLVPEQRTKSSSIQKSKCSMTVRKKTGTNELHGFLEDPLLLFPPSRRVLTSWVLKPEGRDL